MQIAIIKDNAVEKVGEHKALFPNTSFPASGPPADWMTQNSVLPVTVFRPYNGLTEKSTSVDPYICLLYTSPSPRDGLLSRMPSSA